MTFKIITLGCKLNSCESAAIEKRFIEEGWMAADEGSSADAVIVNSCAVTGTAVAKARHTVSRIRRENPDAAIVLCGCFPQSYPEEASLGLDADVIVGNEGKSRVCEYVTAFMRTRIKTVKIVPMTREFDEKTAAPDKDRTRAFIKIEDGCDRFCSYCIIPTARGRVRSLPLEKITEQAVECVADGHKEIVLTGINLGCYGQDLGHTLGDAVKAAAESGVERVRLSSLEPEMITDSEIEKFAEIPALCPHFHLSLQSGSDTVLKRMNRRYDTEYYRNTVNKLRGVFPECTITTDIIVGFPGETDEEFEQTLSFAEEMCFAKIHVFPYSIRKGTIAAELAQVPPAIRSKRVEIMTETADDLEQAFLASQRGTIHTVLIEKPKSPSYSHGFTENYIPVRIYGEQLPRHSMIKVRINGHEKGCCTGTTDV